MGCGVGSGNSGCGSGVVNEIMDVGPEDVLKQYFPLKRLNFLLDGGDDGSGADV